jgi:hypothetical protein
VVVARLCVILMSTYFLMHVEMSTDEIPPTFLLGFYFMHFIPVTIL